MLKTMKKLKNKVQIPPLKIVFSNADIRIVNTEVKEILKSGRLILGDKTVRFEEAFKKCTGRKYAVAVNSGTTAIEIFLRSWGVKGKEIIVPTNTNYATAAAVIFSGGKPKLIDGGLFPSLETIERSVNKKTAGVIIVHIGGYISEEIEKIKKFCNQRGLFLFEDAAHAHGGSFNGKEAGSFGNAAAFSFFPTKVITSCEGGMIVCDDQETYKNALIFRDQGKDLKTGENIKMGNSWRMSEIHAAIGFHQLKHLEMFVKKRNDSMKRYSKLLSGVRGLDLLPWGNEMVPSGYKYIIQFDNKYTRDAVKRQLFENDVLTGGGVYEVPIHKQPIFRPLFRRKKFSIAENFCSRHLCLPIWPNIKKQEIDYISNLIKNILK